MPLQSASLISRVNHEGIKNLRFYLGVTRIGLSFHNDFFTANNIDALLWGGKPLAGEGIYRFNTIFVYQHVADA